MKDIEKYKPKLELIGKNLRKYRKAKALTQKEVAEAVGVSEDYIRKIENAKVLFSMTLLCKFCVLYRIQLKEVLKLKLFLQV